MTGAGVGLGAGLGMGAVMAQTMGQAVSPQQQDAPADRASSDVPDIMTLSEAAAYMRVGEEDMLSVIQSGELKAKKIGTSYRISKKAVDEFLSS
jgi:excisionase family DNA binding protein